jgi:hypothetical protein
LRLNPSATFLQTAASQHNSIRALIEDANGPSAELAPMTFLQGSYRQQTAIYTINDVDIVVLCNLSYPGTPGAGGGKSYSRDEIFRIIAAPLLGDGRYRGKVRYSPTSMCIKVDLSIKVEILPVVFKRGTTDSSREPFVLHRPETGNWEDGYARYHQAWLTFKNGDGNTGGNFIPAIKVLKHIRSRFNLKAVSFHIECLLFRLENENFEGGTADWLARVLRRIASYPANEWYAARIMTPCGDRDIFTGTEWAPQEWVKFHGVIVECSRVAEVAINMQSEMEAIACWQAILGTDFFPATSA